MATKKTLDFVRDKVRIPYESIEDVIIFLQDLIHNRWFNADVVADFDGYGAYEEGCRPPTEVEIEKFDKEQAKEKAKKKADRAKKIESEKAELARLLAKYGKDS